MNKSYLRILLVSTTLISLLSASDVNQKLDLQYTIERAGLTVAMSGKDIAENRMSMVSIICENKGAVKDVRMSNGMYVENKIEAFKCSQNSQGDVDCHLRLSWFVDEYKENKNRISKDRCVPMSPRLVTRDYNFLLKNQKSEILDLGDHVKVDYRLNVTE